MASEAVLVAHAHGLVAPIVPPDPAGVLTVDGRMQCDVQRAFAPISVFAVVTNPGQGASTPAIKATFNAWSSFAPIIGTFVQLFDTVFLLICADDAGNSIDPEEFWITVERYSRP